MSAQVHFINIQSQITGQIGNAKDNIKIAMAWFTDINIFRALLKAAQKDVSITLILLDNETNKRSGLNFRQLEEAGVNVHWYTPKNSGLMHHKFCILDHRLVITGSYNWTSSAASFNKENIIILDDINNTNEYINEFNILMSEIFALYNESLKSKSLDSIENRYLSEQSIEVKRENENNDVDECESEFIIAGVECDIEKIAWCYDDITDEKMQIIMAESFINNPYSEQDEDARRCINTTIYLVIERSDKSKIEVDFSMFDRLSLAFDEENMLKLHEADSPADYIGIKFYDPEGWLE